MDDFSTYTPSNKFFFKEKLAKVVVGFVISGLSLAFILFVCGLILLAARFTIYGLHSLMKLFSSF